MIIDKVRDYVVSTEEVKRIEGQIIKADNKKLMNNNLMIRAVYRVESKDGGNSWIRVRLGDIKEDGKGYASLTYKNMIPFSDRPNLEKSIEVVIGDYDGIIELLDASGFTRESTQETLRKKYVIIDNESEIQYELCIDTWPQLDERFIQLKPDRLISTEDWDSIEEFLEIKERKVKSDSVNQAYIKKFNKSSLDIPYIGFQKFLLNKKQQHIYKKFNENKMYHSLFLYITEACQLKCKHCFIGKRLYEGKQMSKEYALMVARLFKSLGTKSITIIGGEPTLHKDFVEITQKIIEMQFEEVIIDTNGLCIDKIFELEPKEISHIKVSVDSFDSTFHDYIRGMGTHDKTISNIRLLVKKGFRVCVNCTLFTKNIKEILKMRELCCNVGATMLNFHMFSPIGNGENIKELVPTPKECDDAYKDVSKHLSPIMTRFPHTWVKKEEDSQFEKWGYCGCIGLRLERFSVFPNGSAYICTIGDSVEKPYMFINEDGSINLLQDNEYSKFILGTKNEGAYKCPYERSDTEYLPICKCWKQIFT